MIAMLDPTDHILLHAVDIIVMTRLETWPVLKPATRFKTGQPVMKPVNPFYNLYDTVDRF